MLGFSAILNDGAIVQFLNFAVVDFFVSIHALAYLFSGLVDDRGKIALHLIYNFLFLCHLLQLVVLSVLMLHHGERRQVVTLLLSEIVVTALAAFVFFWLEVLKLLSLLKHLVDACHGFSPLLDDVLKHVELIVVLAREVDSSCLLFKDLLFKHADEGEFVLLNLVLLALLLLLEETDG